MTRQTAGADRLHDLPDLGIDAPDGDYATIAGLVLSSLGRLPDGPGDAVDVGDWQVTVTAVDERAITEVHVARRPAGSAGGPGADEGEV